MKRKKKEPINVELIPVYISKEEFADKKDEIQNLIARMLIQAHQDDLKNESVVQSPQANCLSNDKRTKF